MKRIEVVAAIIYKEGTFLATQRGYGEFKGLWEFPGGKIKTGETPQEALIREIKEELDITINVNRFICTTEYDYPQFHLTMHSYLCDIASGNMILKEHLSNLWLQKEDLNKVNWLPADKEVVKVLKSI